MPEQKTIKCPFCEKGDIITIYIPRMMVTTYGRASSNKKAMNFFKNEKYEILSEKCPNCGKNKKEIEKALKEGKQPSNEEIIRRMKEVGLPLKIKESRKA
jgi:Zn ribbon nucleic-acid-binding protein